MASWLSYYNIDGVYLGRVRAEALSHVEAANVPGDSSHWMVYGISVTPNYGSVRLATSPFTSRADAQAALDALILNGS